MARSTIIGAGLVWLAVVVGCGQSSGDSHADGGVGGTGGKSGDHPCGPAVCNANESCWCPATGTCCPTGALCPACGTPSDAAGCDAFAGNWTLSGCMAQELCFVTQTGCSFTMKCGDGAQFTGSVDGLHVTFASSMLSCTGSFSLGSLQGTCTGGDAGNGCSLVGKSSN